MIAISAIKRLLLKRAYRARTCVCTSVYTCSLILCIRVSTGISTHMYVHVCAHFAASFSNEYFERARDSARKVTLGT